MTLRSHLRLTEVALAAGAEWAHDVSCWGLARLHRGHGYWIGKGDAREIQPGEAMIIPPGPCGCFRASQLTGATLQFFSWSPELLTGVLSLSERHYFATAAQNGRQAVRVLAPPAESSMIFDTEQAPIPLISRSRLLQFIGEVFSPEISRHIIPNFKTVLASERFEELINQSTDSEILNHTPAQLAQRCGCSLRHFGRLFYGRFGSSVRAYQTKLRLQKAGLLLADGDTKVIDVALESGYRNLGLFNKMFKKHTGMTPSQWRQRNATAEPRSNRTAKTLALVGTLLSLSLSSFAATPVPAAPSSTNAPAASKTNAVFKISGYRIEGNTVLTPDIIKNILADYIGETMTFNDIKKGLTELQLAYRERGFISAKVSLPPQSLTNGIVKVQITEAPIVDVSISNNKWFSSNNVLATLPSVRTNVMLNSLVFQQELNQANSNPDRQIYPEIAPGPEPGTSALRLKVVDRMPLHANIGLDNQSTPGTPDLRFNTALQYNNLWQLNHQVGVQYNFSPEEFKQTSPLIDYFFDRPQVVSYSGFYRMPLSSTKPESYKNLTSADFGYDEVTRRFRPPAPESGGPELTLYASRSVSDTGNSIQDFTEPNGTVDQIKQAGGGPYLNKVTYSETWSFNEDLGFRVAQPVKFGDIETVFTAGIDYKAYRSFNRQNIGVNASIYKMFDTNLPWTDPNNWSVSSLGIDSFSSRMTPTSVNYLPLTLNWDAVRKDPYGVTSFNFYNEFNFAALSSSDKRDFQVVRQSHLSDGNFYVLNAGLSRDQKIVGDWYLTAKINGQWANEPVISNEQFGLGGLSGPRGYREGEEYGDAGWRVTIEPRTPTWDLGNVDGTMPMRVHFSVFTDYGQRFLYTRQLTDPLGHVLADGGKPQVDMWGAGAGVAGTIGSRFDFRLAFAYPLLNAGGVTAGTLRVYFGLGAQF